MIKEYLHIVNDVVHTVDNMSICKISIIGLIGLIWIMAFNIKGILEVIFK